MMEWKKVKLGEANLQFIDGDRGRNYPQGGEMHPSGHCLFLNAGNVTANGFVFVNNAFISKEKDESLRKGKLQRNDIVLTTRGTIGNVAVYSDDIPYEHVRINSGMVILRCGEDLFPQFIYYVLRSSYFQGQIRQSQSGSAQPQLPISTLNKLEIPLPPLPTQRRIAAILSSLDAQIENNNRINRNLEAQAQALFKSWFVDFEPWGGVMPEGWREYEFAEIAKIISGYSYKGTELQVADSAMATIKNFDRAGYFKPEGYKEIIVGGKTKPEQYVNLFDVIVAHTDLTQNAEIIGNPAIILTKAQYKEIIISMDLCKVVPISKYISMGFLYCLLKDTRFKQHALGYVNGTTVLHMSKKALPDYKIMLPNDLSQLEDFSVLLQNLFIQCSNNTEANTRLASLRDTLLPKLMKGEIEV